LMQMPESALAALGEKGREKQQEEEEAALRAIERKHRVG
jgi:hypothetical protein